MASSLGPKVLFIGLLSAMTSFVALAIDVNPLQDFCVADTDSPVLVNGLVCKNPANVTADDFFTSGLNIVGDTSNRYGLNVTPASVGQIPGLNTLSLTLVRIDYAPSPGGVNPPHVHPRATELIIVLKGKVRAGFVTSGPNNRLFIKDLNEGDVFVFPEGLIHFNQNIGKDYALAFAAFNSQNPGGISDLPDAVFGSEPDIPADFLAKAFLMSVEQVEELQERFDEDPVEELQERFDH